MEKQINVGLFGLGTVGTGVVKALERHGELIRNRSGYNIRIKTICVRNLDRVREVNTAKYKVTTNSEHILNDPEINVVIEAIGGIEPARSYIKEALEKGKHVVTANKALISKYGQELFELAAEKRVNLAFEASVCGSIPIIKGIRESFVANSISSISGIVNGTTNFILTKMAHEGKSYESALEEAQHKGFAEADPSFDVGGKDAAQKIAILAMLAFNTAIDPDTVYTEGIQDIMAEDIRFAENWGYVIKLIALAKKADSNGKGIDVRVHPMLIQKKHPLASVEGELNAVYLSGDLVDGQMFYGKGAGQFPTASAVISDVIDVMRSVAVVRNFNSLPLIDINDLEFSYYLRLPVIDRPGVLYKVAKVLATSGVSIAELVQPTGKEVVPIVIKTHKAKERMIRHAFNEINKLAVVKKGAVMIRIQD